MMKKKIKMLTALLAAGILFSLPAGQAMAADAPYTYTVTLYTGNKGVLENGSTQEVKSDLTYNTQLTYNINSVTVTDDRYYVKGFRLSGRDNEDALASPVVTVTGDADYVVAYGIKGDQVAYTVAYEDENGNELAPSDVYYGNIGDKPVVAYKYIEDYVPQALALTKTLSDNEAENIFTFTYTPGETGTVVETTTTVTTVEGTAAEGTTGTAGAAGTAGTGAAGTAGEAGAGEAAGEVAGEEGTETPVVENPDEETPQSLVDLDDEETPLANVDASDEDTAKGLPLAASIATGVVAAIALIAIFVVFFRKKMR